MNNATEKSCGRVLVIRLPGGSGGAGNFICPEAALMGFFRANVVASQSSADRFTGEESSWNCKLERVIHEAALIWDFEWVFLCSEGTVIQACRLLELAALQGDFFCNDTLWDECGLLSLEAGILVRKDLMMGRVSGIHLTNNGPRIEARANPAVNPPVPTPRLHFNDLVMITPHNDLVSHYGRDSVSEAVQCIWSFAPSRRWLLLRSGSAEYIDVWEAGCFLSEKYHEYGRFGKSEALIHLDWSRRGRESVPCTGSSLISPVAEIRESLQDRSNGIPRIMHFIWIGGALPQWAERNIASWRAHYPDWEVRIWGDDDKHIFRELFDPGEFEWFSSIPVLVIRSDLLRMAILRKYGGVYIDTDFVCFSDFLERIPSEIRFGFGEKPGGLPECALILSEAGHPFLTWFIWKAWVAWGRLTPGDLADPTHTRVVWRVNSFGLRASLFFPEPPDRHLFLRGRAWASIGGDTISISHHFLHGAIDSLARHDYSHTWW